MSEKWLDINGFNGRYQVSSLGNIRSQDYRIEQTSRWGHRVARIMPGKLMKPTDNGSGYLIVGLRQGAVRKNHYVHRLVAEAFCLKSDGASEVNHIDANPHNNQCSNLEWVTHQSNIDAAVPHMKHQKNSRLPKSGEKYILFKRNQYRLVIKGKIDLCFDSLDEAVRAREVILNGGQHHAVE